MQLILTDAAGPRPLPFYLALEEWLALRCPPADYFFLWQVSPTVIVGRHQLLENEVDTAFCRAHGIDICRRKSGGGAVLADMNNIMLSYVTPSDNVVTTFSAYTSMVAKALRALGLDASDNARNDILIGGRKVSGNSYYHLAGRSIVHGTMLFDCDRPLMGRVLTPASAKLDSHGVSSVRSRITTVREHLPALTLADFRRHLAEVIPGGGPTRRLTPAEIAEVEALERPYHSPAWVAGRSSRGTRTATARIDGVGTLTAHLAVKGGLVEHFALTGDYLERSPASDTLASALAGLPYSPEALGPALAAAGVDGLIPGLTPDALLTLIFADNTPIL